MPDHNDSAPENAGELDVVIHAPNGRDAQVLCDMIESRENVRCLVAASIKNICDRIRTGVGAIILTSETLSVNAVEQLKDALNQQLPWSDIPLILLTRSGTPDSQDSGVVTVLKGQANTMLVERPAQVVTMTSAVRSALRARRRQYAVRGYLDAIRSSESQLRFALHAGKMGTWNLDLATEKMTCSEGFYSIIGIDWPPEHTTLDQLRSHICIDDIELVRERFSEARRDRVELLDEFRIIRPDGSVRWVETRACFSYDDENVPTHAAGVMIDIDERKRAEEQLRASQKLAQAANAAKDQFLAVLSHELRTPLTPVLAMVQMLQDDENLPADLREPMNIIRRNMELEARLIDDLLDLTRIVRNKLELHRAPLSLHAALRSAIGICRQDAEHKRIDIVECLEATEDTIDGDTTRLQQVFWNLLKNAIKFTPERGTITVTTEGNARDGLCVRVKDSGVGIAPDLLPRVFNAFEQGGREMTRAFGGLGLGLTISKAIVEAHGAQLSASSEGLSRGATFSVSFVPQLKDSAVPAPSNHRRRGSDSISPRKILLVEDHPDTGAVLSEFLRGLGHNVHLAETLAAAGQELRCGKFDLLISDLGLPDGSGLSVMQQARNRDATPGIALSGYGAPEDIERSLAAGFSEHLTKPVDVAHLKAAVSRVAAGEPAGADR